jgi:hypothetical protein
MMNRAYIDAVRLLLEVAPEVFHDPVFALKGGTAINLFLHDMPRLSVDLDLVYTDHSADRDEALQHIGAALAAASATLESRGIHCERGSSAEETKLFVERARVRVKIEINHVFRGTVLPVVSRPLSENGQSTFFTDIELPVLDPDEIYGSKLVAAMDRQHPRDLFDVLGLYARNGLTPRIVECFVCYLAGHNRPIHEVLFANPIDITRAYSSEFAGMTRESLALDELLQVRTRLFSELPSALTAKHRDFLLGLLRCEPDWSLMHCPHLKDMPAIRWKLANLQRLREANPGKFAAQKTELLKRLEP